MQRILPIILIIALILPGAPIGIAAPPVKVVPSGYAKPQPPAFNPAETRKAGATPVKPEVIFHGSRTLPYIALTFDACQARIPTGYDKRIIDILIKTKTPATFFMGGKWVEAHQREAKFLGIIPFFELGNHSYSHPLFTRLPDRAIAEEIDRTQEIIYKITGRQVHYFRAPYGKYNLHVSEIAASRGLKLVQWDVVSSDPDPKMDEKKLARIVLNRAKNGSIIIMHANGRGWHTSQALPVIIDDLKKKGFTFVTLSRLMELTAGKAGTSDKNFSGKNKGK